MPQPHGTIRQRIQPADATQENLLVCVTDITYAFAKLALMDFIAGY